MDKWACTPKAESGARRPRASGCHEHELLSSFDSMDSLRQAQAAIVGNYESFDKTGIRI